MTGGRGRAPGAGSPVLTSCFSQKLCSWMVSCFLALQHLAVQSSLLCIFHLLLLPTLPQEPPHAQTTSKLLARSLFACGISTVLQTTLGSRLPLVQIPSFEYLVPAMVLSSHLSSSSSTDRNGTIMARTCLIPNCRDTGSWADSLQEVLLPFSGVCIVCAILSYFHIPWESLDVTMAQLSWANSTFNAPWIHIPYAGWVPLDLLFLSVLMAPVFLTGFLSFFLENTVSGTLEERGLLSEQPWKARAGDFHLHGERGEASQAYRLPTVLRRLLPSSCKTFLCCFLCPRSEEEEEGSSATEEGTAAPGEGTHLLPKLSSGEQQPAIRPSQTDMPAWHTAA